MGDASDPRPVVFSILADAIPCPDRAYVYSISSFENAWHREAPVDWAWFWIRLFIKDPELLRRMTSAYHAIGRGFANLERLHLAVYGTPARVPRPIIEMERREVLSAWFPRSFEILNYAQGAAAETVARDLRRFIGEEQWRREFSS